MLAEIDPIELSMPAMSLYDTLTHGVSTVSPAELRNQIDQIDPDSFGDRVEIFEYRAHARLIELLSRATDDDAGTAADRYERALFRLTSDDDTDVPVDAETVRQSVDPDAVEFSDAARAVYDHLAGEEPAHTTDELHERVDTLFADDDLERLESLVCSARSTTNPSERGTAPSRRDESKTGPHLPVILPIDESRPPEPSGSTDTDGVNAQTDIDTNLTVAGGLEAAEVSTPERSLACRTPNES